MARTKPGQGQTALVTGASAGIGVDLAECFARDGYDLILSARGEGALQQVAVRLAQAHSVRAHVIAQDLGAIGGGSALADAIKAKGLEVDVVVNNAGYGHAGALTSSDLATQLGMIDLNVRALVELTYLYWDRMLANKRGGVLNVASTAAFQPGPLMANYYASKAYVLSFSEALWEEARGTGVHVSCLCPGPTVSKFRERAGTDKTQLAKNAGAAMASAPVARMGYEGFKRNTRVVVTGARNAMQAGMVRYLPRTTLLRIVRNLQSPAVHIGAPMSLHGSYDPNNLFAKMLRGEIACVKAFEDEVALAFMDIFPQSRGHTLVVPKNVRARNFLELPREALGPYLDRVQRVAIAVERALKPDGVQIMQFNGGPAGQTVFHLHFHIIPRYEGVQLAGHGRGNKADAAELEAIAAQIAAAL